jgi:hypothetical protein
LQSERADGADQKTDRHYKLEDGGTYVNEAALHNPAEIGESGFRGG